MLGGREASASDERAEKASARGLHNHPLNGVSSIAAMGAGLVVTLLSLVGTIVLALAF
jgi:hypothetical protein